MFRLALQRSQRVVPFAKPQLVSRLMPPNRAASSKRKVSVDSDGESSGVAATKKPKIDTSRPENTVLASNGQPTNKVLPVKIEFNPRPADTLRIAAWNVTSLASSHKKGFRLYVEAEEADILVLTETKVNDVPIDPVLSARYPYRYWSISEKKSYAGTAILSKIEPLSVSTTLPGSSAGKGRIVTLEFEKAYVVGTYVVNAGEKLKTLDAKKEWNTAFEAYVRDLDSKKPVVWAGDLNVAPTSRDLANPKTNWNKTAGYTEAETSWYRDFLTPPTQAIDLDPSADGSSAVVVPRGKFHDIWRDMHPGLQHYTYFSYRFNARAKGMGWRIDMFVLSERIKDKVQMCEIRGEIWGASDHCPIVLDISQDTVL